MDAPSSNAVMAVVERARRSGAAHAEALCAISQGWDLELQHGRPVSQREIVEERLHLKVWSDGRCGCASGPWEARDDLIETALSATRPADPLDGPVQRIQPLVTGLSIEDRRWDWLATADRVEVLLDAQRSARAVDRRLELEQFKWSDRSIVRLFANDRGLVGTERSHRYAVSGEVAVRLQSGTRVLTGGLEARTYASICSLPFGVDLARRASALLAPAAEITPGPIRVLLSSPVVAGLLDRLARLCVTGVAERSFLASAAFDPSIHVVDDPVLPSGLRTRAFDDRGVPPIPITLIREGRLHARYLDPLTAAKNDVRPSGHVWGDALGPSNLVLRQGGRSVHVILSDAIGPTFAPDDLSQATLDPQTGRLEGLVSGTVFRGAEPAGSVLERRIVGDLGQILSGVLEISNETDRIGHVDAPAIVVEGFSLD
jgi:PmbA protein